jgi:hypothetical protein
MLLRDNWQGSSAEPSADRAPARVTGYKILSSRRKRHDDARGISRATPDVAGVAPANPSTYEPGASSLARPQTAAVSLRGTPAFPVSRQPWRSIMFASHDHVLRKLLAASCSLVSLLSLPAVVAPTHCLQRGHRKPRCRAAVLGRSWLFNPRSFSSIIRVPAS